MIVETALACIDCLPSVTETALDRKGSIIRFDDASDISPSCWNGCRHASVGCKDGRFPYSSTWSSIPSKLCAIAEVTSSDACAKSIAIEDKEWGGKKEK